MRLSDPDPETARRAALGSVAAAAGLLLTVSLLGLRIAKRGQHIKDSLEGIRNETQVLWDIPKMNFALEEITGQLRKMRKGAEA